MTLPTVRTTVVAMKKTIRLMREYHRTQYAHQINISVYVIKKYNYAPLLFRMVAPFDPKSHVTDEALELYTLHMLSEAEQEMVEIHLLICDVCQSASDRIDAEIAAIRTSLQQLEDRKVALQQKTSARKIVIFKTLGPK